ncbi:hypothetical protein BC829DRAFT_430463 [Chytridium lagenaria]|nr:hypothetical protein BC829DRAFT_430463 [Chytridium lagenaria]
MRYDLDAFYVVPYRYPNGAFPTDHPSYPEFISLVPSASAKDTSQRVRVTVVHKGGITDIPSEHCILKPKKFEVSDGVALSPGSSIIRLLGNPYVTAHSSVEPLVLYRLEKKWKHWLIQSWRPHAAIDSSSSNKKKKSKQEKLIDAHLANERQKIRDYADELPALLSYARALLLRDELHRKEKANSLKKNDRYAFEIGDRVWFSMPLRTDKQGREDSQIKKFQFRWQANAARLRPYHIIPPKDSADKAAKGVVDDDFAQEIELWKKMKVAEGVNRELFKRFDSDVAEGQYDDPEFYVERLEDHTLENSKEYEYKVKWLGQGPYHNTWLLEREIPSAIVRDYWNGLAKTNVKEFFKRLAHVDKHGIPKREKIETRFTDASDNAGFQELSSNASEEVIVPNPEVEPDDRVNGSRDMNPLELVSPREDTGQAKDDDVPLALEDFFFPIDTREVFIEGRAVDVIYVHPKDLEGPLASGQPLAELSPTPFIIYSVLNVASGCSGDGVAGRDRNLDQDELLRRVWSENHVCCYIVDDICHPMFGVGVAARKKPVDG